MIAYVPVLGSAEPAMVDEADLPLVADTAWRISSWGYAVARGRQDRLGMHRLIMAASKGTYIDHRDGNPLNNTRANLRFATSSQNQANRRRMRAGMTSRYRGVCWNAKCRKWQAGIKVGGRSQHLGLHATEEEAARAYDRAALRLFGEYAVPNFATEAA